MTIRVFIDDSGSEPRGKVFVLGGFISTAERWEALSAEWDAVCAAAPATPDFHMAAAWRINRGYWGDRDEATQTALRDRRLLDLAKVIERQVQASITCTVTWRTYDESLRGQVPRHLDNPYFFLLWQMLQMIGTWSRDVAPAEKIELVLDQQNEAGRRVLAWYPRLLAVMDESDRQALPAAPVFRADRDLPPLKAADMWAWFWRREAIDRERHRRTRSSYERPAFGDVLCGIAPVNRNLEADDLKAIAQRLKAAKLPK